MCAFHFNKAEIMYQQVWSTLCTNRTLNAFIQTLWLELYVKVYGFNHTKTAIVVWKIPLYAKREHKNFTHTTPQWQFQWVINWWLVHRPVMLTIVQIVMAILTWLMNSNHTHLLHKHKAATISLWLYMCCTLFTNIYLLGLRKSWIDVEAFC